MTAIASVGPADATGQAAEPLERALNVLTNYFNIVAGVANDWPAVIPAHPPPDSTRS